MARDEVPQFLEQKNTDDPRARLRRMLAAKRNSRASGGQLRQANQLLGTMGGEKATNLRSAQKQMNKLSKSVRGKMDRSKAGVPGGADATQVNTDYLPPSIPTELKPAPEQRPVLELD